MPSFDLLFLTRQRRPKEPQSFPPWKPGVSISRGLLAPLAACVGTGGRARFPRAPARVPCPGIQQAGIQGWSLAAAPWCRPEGCSDPQDPARSWNQLSSCTSGYLKLGPEGQASGNVLEKEQRRSQKSQDVKIHF